MKLTNEITESITMKMLVVISLTLFAASSQAEEVYEIRDARANSDVFVSNIAGEIEVEGWSRNEVEVRADLGSGVEKFIFEVDDEEVVIKVKGPRRHARRIASDLYIKIPKNSSLTVSAVSADIVVENVEGRLIIEAVSGDIEATAFASNIDIESVSGDIDVEGTGGKIRTRVDTVSGDIDVENVHGEIEAASVSGDVVIYDGAFESVESQTVSGDIVYHAALHGESRLDMETVSGEIDIKFAGEISARIDIETFDGAIRNCFGPEPQRTSRYAPGKELVFTEGGGEGRVVIRTLSGGVRLCRE